MKDVMKAFGLEFADRVCIVCKERPSMGYGLMTCGECCEDFYEDMRKICQEEQAEKESAKQGHKDRV